MVKVSIKKNIKPKKTKKTVKPNKKEKDQTQTQTVNISINDTITKKRRGRPTKRTQEIKKPIQQPIAPVIQSYNQPVFNKPAPQQSSLSSSILASQEKPSIMKKEIKEETALQKALIEQNTETAESKPIVNELERIRDVRVKKLEEPELKPLQRSELFFPSFKKINKESRDPVKKGLLGQLLDEKGDDTEEINALISSSVTGGLFSPPIIPNPFSGVSIPKISNPLSGVSIPKISNPLSGVSIPKISNPLSGLPNYLDSFLDEEEPPINEYAGGIEESKVEEPDSQSLLSGSSNIPSNTSSLLSSGVSTPTPLSTPVNPQSLTDKLNEIQDEQPIDETKEETFLEETKDEEDIPSYTPKQLSDYKKYTEEVKKKDKPIIESPLTIQSQEPPKQILEPIATPPKITKGLQAEEPAQFTELKSPEIDTEPEKPEVSSFEDKIKGFKALQLGQLLIDNNIDNKEGMPFFIDGGHVKSELENKLSGNIKKTQMNKTELKRYLTDAYEKGLINI